ncbi:hypothetical protein FA95DRAFT_739587 [Auriscalpium vulgare]|uniref:Uncharacterized protein n=1 Tax=Auriscalpium vulgare TaxID=40419 RepID=A0ACB8SAF1_9AGAM|nr:hypothetical protein FA95DRAFT_739587 [Auriscalpium vulgare]
MIAPTALSKAKSLTPIMEHADSLCAIATHSTSSFVLPPLEQCEPVQFMDENSGAIFARVDKAAGGHVSVDEFERGSLKSAASLSLHIGSPPPAAVEDMHEHIASLPSFVLTIPTPELPSSPVFVPQPPFNPNTFLEAADLSTPLEPIAGPRRPVSSPVPALPRCDHPVPEGEPGELCRACETQMLACRMWYQERDSGRRQSLREPLIRPGESTASNRMLMEMLGLPVVGLGIDFAEDAAALALDELGAAERVESEREDGATGAVPARGRASRRRQVRRLSRHAKGVMKKVTELLRHHPSQRAATRGSDAPKQNAARPTSFLALEDSVPVLLSRRLWRRSE